MTPSHTPRIIADILICIGAFLLPWWMLALVALVALFFFDRYIEIIFFGFMLDCLYGTKSGFDAYLFTFIGFVIFSLQILVKEKMRF